MSFISKMAMSLVRHAPVLSYATDKLAENYSKSKYSVVEHCFASKGDFSRYSLRTGLLAEEAISFQTNGVPAKFGGLIGCLRSKDFLQYAVAAPKVVSAPERALSIEKRDLKVLVIPGGVSGPAMTVALKWLHKGPDREVIMLVRKESDAHREVELDLKGRVKWIVTEVEDYESPERMEALIDKTLEGKHIAELGMVSCVGSSILVDGLSYEQMNVDPVVNTARAIIEVAKRRKVIHIGLSTISSIAASLVSTERCPYVASRIKADHTLLDIVKQAKLANPDLHISGVSMRPGLMKPGTDPDAIGEYYPWDTEQLVNLFVLIVPGSGRMDLPLIATEDLADALINCVDSEEELCEIVDAITSHRYTYNQVMDVFAGLIGRKLTRLYTPTEIFRLFATEVPHGKMAPYSGQLFDILDHEGAPKLSHERFEQLLGKASKSLEEICPKGEIYVFPEPPIFEYAGKVLETVADNPEIDPLSYRCPFNGDSLSPIQPSEPLERLVYGVLSNLVEMSRMNAKAHLTGVLPEKQPGVSIYAKKADEAK